MIDDKQYILPKDLNSGKAIREVVRRACLSNVCVLPENDDHTEEYHRATLIIACDNGLQTATVLAEKRCRSTLRC